MSMPASEPTAAPAEGRMSRYRFLKKRRRVQKVPMQALLVGVVFCALAALAEYGILPSRTNQEEVRMRENRHLEELRASRSLQTTPDFSHLLPNGQCPEKTAVANSTYPPLGFEDDKPAATLFMAVVTLYMFLGLAIVCDSFFESALSAISEAQGLKDDVAGATWMAAGGSAPELATSIMGVFISRSDVGFGTIVGSAVFNVLFVIACCAFVAPNLTLTWWPLARDCAYYCLSLAMIVFVTADDFMIAVWEAIVLLWMYVGYVTIMYFNERLEAWVISRVTANETNVNSMQKMMIKIIDHPVFAGFLYLLIFANGAVIIGEMIDDNARAERLPCVCGINLGVSQLPNSAWYWANFTFNMIFIVEMLMKFYAYGFFGYWKIKLNCFDGALVFLIVVELILIELSKEAAGDDPLNSGGDGIPVGVARIFRVLRFVRFVRILRLVRVFGAFGGSSAPGATETNKVVPENELKEDPEKAKPVEEAPAEEEEDDDDDGPYDPFEIPEGGSLLGWIGRFIWLIGLPLSIGMWATIPDCRIEPPPFYRKKIPAWAGTFTMCIVWIAALAAVMVWMVDRFGKMYNVPDSIMGYTLLAAGTSIPDCLSSIAVARRGHGDMAVSSSIGSNIFDVLIGLPVPWFMYTAILRPALGADFGPTWVPVNSESMAVLILLLFIMVALVVTTIHASGWALSVRLGMAMMTLYFVFLVVAMMLEFNVFYPDCKIVDPMIGGR